MPLLNLEFAEHSGVPQWYFFFFLIKQRLFASTFCHVMIKPFFMSISVVSIGEVFTARFMRASKTLSLLTGAMFETKAILLQVTSHHPQAPKQH